MRSDGKLKYLIFMLVSYALIWGPVAAILKYSKPVYISSWTLAIPGSGAGSSLNLDDLGQATSTVNSPYQSSSVDPKVNYKTMILSRLVLQNAASRLGINRAELGKPKISLVDQTSLMQFSIQASSAEMAYDKANSIYMAFEEELDRLRNDEYRIRREGNLESIQNYQTSADQAQQKMLDFQSSSKVVSSDQFEKLAASIEEYRIKVRDLEVRIEGLIALEGGMRKSLGVVDMDAGMLLRLISDPVMKSYYSGLSAARQEYVEASSSWGAKHPKVLLARSKIGEFRSAIRTRLTDITGNDDLTMQDSVAVDSSGQSEALLGQLIVKYAERLAAESEHESMRKQLDILETELKDVASQTAVLESLERSHQVATTVFMSALAKVDLGQSDFYASYPMTQLLIPPSLPDKAEKMHKVFTVLGGVAGSGFVTVALVILWQRKALIRITLKRS